MAEINVWDNIVNGFGFKAPSTEEKKGFADVIIPLQEDIVVIEEKVVEDFRLAEDLTIHNLLDGNKKEDCNNLINDWGVFYKGVVQEGVARLNFTESNIEKDNKRVHKLLVLRGIDDVAKRYYSSNFGGLLYNSGIKEDRNGNVKIDFGMGMLDKKTKDSIKLFSYGLQDTNTHIITEQQLDFLLSYIPTLQGLVDYLSWKAHLLSTINVMSVDEYTLLLSYLLYIFKGSKQGSIFVPFEDKDIVDFVESELSKELLKASSIFQGFLGYVSGNDEFIQHYLLFSLKSQLMFAEQLAGLIYMDYNVHSSKTFMMYQGKNLYVFHNVDERIKEGKIRTVYSGHFISKVAVEYLETIKEEIEIEKTICCIMHKDGEDRLYTTFVGLDLKDMEDANNLREIKEFAMEGESIGWLPKTIALEQLIEQKKSEIRASIPEQKGSDRNKSCPCGSGKKYKKCCGKYQ